MMGPVLAVLTSSDKWWTSSSPKGPTLGSSFLLLLPLLPLSSPSPPSGAHQTKAEKVRRWCVPAQKEVEKVRQWCVPAQIIRKASLFFGGRSEKRLGRISPPQSSVIGGRMHSEEEGEEALLTRL